MAQNFVPLSTRPSLAAYRPGDVLVIFGEVFSRGYVNGLIEAAQARGMRIIYSTIGRRTEDGSLRPLFSEELEQMPTPLINVPLEAGFERETDSKGSSVFDQIRDIKASNWEQAELNWESIQECQKNATLRFRNNTQNFINLLEPLIPKGAHVLFAHTMAGGIFHSKIMMLLLNRVFRGSGERFVSSEKFWNSQLGKLCSENFFEVTAESYKHLLDISGPLREKLENSGSKVRYLAYGYHGTEILIQNQYLWQSYAPYMQGWAKLRLEAIAQNYWSRGVRNTVFNCPEILTNSSSVFQGVEISLYPLIHALLKEAEDSSQVQSTLQSCLKLLNPTADFAMIKNITDKYLSSDLIRRHCDFNKWPQHNTLEQLEYMLKTSEELRALHLNKEQLINEILSELVVKACGQLMLDESFKPREAVLWIGHQIIAQSFLS